MKKAGIAVIIMLALIATNVLASDIIHGEVIDIDREAMKMTIRTSSEESGEMMRIVSLTEKLLIKNQAGAKRLPGCIQPGNRVRVWGTVNDLEEEKVFVAEEIRGCGMGGCNDPTGVRDRLNKSRKRNCCR